MTGPTPTIALGALRTTQSHLRRPLACLLNRIPEVEVRARVDDRVWGIWESYSAKVAAVRASPREREIKEAVARRHEEIARAILLLGDPLPSLQYDPDRTPEMVAQFHAALDDLLRAQRASVAALRRSADRALEEVRAFDRQHTALLAAMENGLEASLFQKVSEQALRHRVMALLHRALVEESRDGSIGANSLITLLVMELERPPQMGTADEYSFRKGLARQIATAVKGYKGE